MLNLKIPPFLQQETDCKNTDLILQLNVSYEKDGPFLMELRFYSDSIWIFNSNQYYKMNLQFDIKFTVIRQNSITNNKSKLGTPIGLKFERNASEAVLELYSDNKNEILRWRDELGKVLNQTGFPNYYKAIKKIGKGSSATVYLAERIQDSKKFAVKSFAKEALSVQVKGMQSLINEINILRSINHDCLMKLYEVYESENSIYLIIQHLEGGQLFQKNNNRRFSTAQIQKMLKRLVLGLEYLDYKRIIHRDLKPENLIFRTNGALDIVISDFGFATKIDQKNYIFTRCGTPGYVAPQILNFKDKNGQKTISDVFSLGIIAHILSTGRSPFPGKDYQSILQQNRICKFNFNLQIYSTIQSSLLDIIKKMIEPDITKRIKITQILSQPFFLQQQFTINEIVEINQEQDFVFLVKNKYKQRKKIQDSVGSFVINKNNILKGTNEQYNSMNSIKSDHSVGPSPQSPKVLTPGPLSPSLSKGSKFLKISMEGDIQSKFFRNRQKKAINKSQRMVALDDLRQNTEEIKKQQKPNTQNSLK